MHVLLALFAAAAVQAAPPADAHKAPVHCRWEATQSNGIPTKVCLTDRQRAQRTAYEQQQIRENQQKAYMVRN